MNRKNIFPFAISAALVMGGMSSCQEDCRCHEGAVSTVARCNVTADWSKYDKETVGGMTVHCFNSSLGSAEHLATHDINEASLNLPVGVYNIALFSHSVNEYSYLQFDGMDRWSSAEINAVNYEEESWYTDDRLIEEPEWIGIDFAKDIDITQDMANAYAVSDCNCTDCECIAGHVPSEGINVANFTPLNIIWKLRMNVHILGIHNLRSARAAISGLADGYKFSLGHAKETTAAQLLPNWQLTLDEADPSVGDISCEILTFGLPYGHNGRFDINPFNIELLLVDNKTMLTKKFEISDGIEVDPENQLITINLNYGSPLPEVQPAEIGSGFKPDVEEWEDGGDFPLHTTKPD